MSPRPPSALVIGFSVITGGIITLLYLKSPIWPTTLITQRLRGCTSDESELIPRILKQQRDQLSAAMMNLSQSYMQYQCKIKPHGISTHGGWCANDGAETSTQHYTDRRLISKLIELFQNCTVASFGDGPGLYKRYIDESGKVLKYDAYDGAPFTEDTSKGTVKFLDLTIPAYGLKIYDWVMSLEVGEHIPEQYEKTVINNIANHARLGVVLSCAIPGQPGHGHVNGRTPEYILAQMEARGFYHDLKATQLLQEGASFAFLKANTNVYRRKEPNKMNELMI